MKYKELTIDEKINVKSWIEYYTNQAMSEYIKNLRCQTLTYILIQEERFCELPYHVTCNKDYPCNRDTLLFRKNWHFKHLQEPAWIRNARFDPLEILRQRAQLKMREVECPQTELEPVQRDEMGDALIELLNIKTTENE